MFPAALIVNKVQCKAARNPLTMPYSTGLGRAFRDTAVVTSGKVDGSSG